MTTSAAEPTLRRRRAASKSPTVLSKSVEQPDDTSKTRSPRGGSDALLSLRLSWGDAALAAALLIAALFVRFYRLSAITSVIFDEVHYLNFDNYILTNRYFFDVNPVFGKLAIAYIARLLGYLPGPQYQTLGEPLPAVQAFAARAPAALFGALTVPVFYRVCRLLRLSTFASLMGALFILFDSMHVIQSRIAMVDSVLVFFTCAAFCSALLLWDAKNVVIIKRRSVSLMDALRVGLYLVLTGICCGLCVSVRWTAFATPALIFTVSLFGIAPFLNEPLHIVELVVLYASAFASYVGSFAWFVWQVPDSGPGDGFMSTEFQACLKGNDLYKGPESCTMSMWARIAEINTTIWRYSKAIRGNDKWGSSWFQWIVNWRGALYYRQQVGGAGSDKLALIYVLMNPVMTLSIDLLMGLFVVMLFYTVRYRKNVRTTEAFKQHLRRGSALFFAWVSSMLPTMVVYRSGPVYQYLPGLFFAQALGAVGFDLIPRKLRPPVAAVLTAGMIAAFLYWSPWVYGLPLSRSQHVERRWLPRWD